MEHEGHRMRMRKRFMRDGMRSFEPHEVLEMLLFYAIPRRDTNVLAHRLIKHFGSFEAVLEADAASLAQVEGMGEGAAVLIAMLLPTLRMYLTGKTRPGHTIRDFAQIDSYCRSLFLGATREQCYVLALDAKLRLKGCELLSEGAVSSVEMNPRLVLGALLKYGATGAVLTHNHLSDVAAPSAEDAEATRLIAKLLEETQVRLYDHVIVASRELYSFSRDQTIPFEPDEIELPGGNARLTET